MFVRPANAEGAGRPDSADLQAARRSVGRLFEAGALESIPAELARIPVMDGTGKPRRLVWA